MASQGVSKLTVERNARILLELVALPGNDACADCKSRAPRWASHNLGIFLCVNCATIHRKIGTHVTKVKSLTLDSWTKEQVDNMKQIGNVKANQRWNPDERRNPPPTDMEELSRDSELEKYIRAKYEFKRFVDRPVQAAAPLGPSRSAASLATPSRTRALDVSPSSVPPPPVPKDENYRPRATPSPSPAPPVPQPLPKLPPSQVQGPLRASSQPYMTQAPPHLPIPVPQPLGKPLNSNNPLWDDLISLQGPSTNTSFPLQYQSSLGPPSMPVSSSYSYTGSTLTAPVPSFTPSSAPLALPVHPEPHRSASMPIFATSPSPAMGNMTMPTTGNLAVGMGMGMGYGGQQFSTAPQQQFQQTAYGAGAGVVSPPAATVTNPYMQQSMSQSAFGIGQPMNMNMSTGMGIGVTGMQQPSIQQQQYLFHQQQLQQLPTQPFFQQQQQSYQQQFTEQPVYQPGQTNPFAGWQQQQPPNQWGTM